MAGGGAFGFWGGGGYDGLGHTSGTQHSQRDNKVTRDK
jgi:hypothetical protein